MRADVVGIDLDHEFAISVLELVVPQEVKAGLERLDLMPVLEQDRIDPGGRRRCRS
jgi:hypothetical protein